MADIKHFETLLLHRRTQVL